MTESRGVRTIAIFEAAKAVVALLAATGVGLHRQLVPIVARLATHLHLDPAKGRPRVLLDALEAGASAHLRLLAAGVLVYAAARTVEAVGLWKERRWALWLGALSAAIYLPFELARIVHRPSLLSASLLLVNAAVAYALSRRVIERPAPPHRPS